MTNGEAQLRREQRARVRAREAEERPFDRREDVLARARLAGYPETDQPGLEIWVGATGLLPIGGKGYPRQSIGHDRLGVKRAKRATRLR